MSKLSPETDDRIRARQRRLSDLAQADAAALAHLWSDYSKEQGAPRYTSLRAAEIGTVMVQGRAGASGAAFNLGEMTVTRTSVKLACGTVGHGYVQGRSKEAAEIVAVIDALAEAGQADAVDQAILAPLRDAKAKRRATRAEKAGATKVEFFTMVRGDT